MNSLLTHKTKQRQRKIKEKGPLHINQIKISNRDPFIASQDAGSSDSS